MKDLSRLGRALFIIAILALGIQTLVSSSAIYELEPLPSWLHDQVILANLTGFFLVAVTVGLLIKRLARAAAVALTVVLALWVLILHARLLMPDPAPDLSFAFETLALAGVAWALATGTISDTERRLQESAAGLMLSLGHYVFGVSLIAFCAVNVIYHDLIANMVPAWIPTHLFWAYFTGFASLAAGLAILTGIWSRAALVMTGIMYGSWVLVIHVPYVSAHPHARIMWTDMFITLALSGGSWFLLGTVSSCSTVITDVRKLRRTVLAKHRG